MRYFMIGVWFLAWAIIGYLNVRSFLNIREKKRIEKALAEGYKMIPKETRLPYDVLVSEQVIYSPYYRSFFMK